MVTFKSSLSDIHEEVACRGQRHKCILLIQDLDLQDHLEDWLILDEL